MLALKRTVCSRIASSVASSSAVVATWIGMLIDMHADRAFN